MNVKELRDLLGYEVLLLPWPKGSKGDKRKWGHLTVGDMEKPDYLAKLDHGNIGVALGAKSGNLVALDVDDDSLVEAYLTANPWLNTTLQTHGARGRVFWLQMVGDYPAKTVKLTTHSGGEAGEWRAGTNSQSIIQGIHPNGNRYQMMNKIKPLGVDFVRIVWPKEIINPPQLESQLLVTATEEPDESEESEDTKDTKELDEVCLCLFSVHSVEDAVRVAAPTAPHQNYKLALILGRAVKALEAQAGKLFTPQQHIDLHKQWIERADQFLRPEHSKEYYFMEYLNAYKLAKYPLGSFVLAHALEAAKKKPISPDVLTWAKTPDVRLLAAICRELQNFHGDNPFFLSGRMVQKIFKHETHATGAKWLRSLCVMQVLEEIKKGIGMKASRYRFKLTGT